MNKAASLYDSAANLISAKAVYWLNNHRLQLLNLKNSEITRRLSSYNMGWISAISILEHFSFLQSLDEEFMNHREYQILCDSWFASHDAALVEWAKMEFEQLAQVAKEDMEGITKDSISPRAAQQLFDTVRIRNFKGLAA
jgi:hypothetical protein